MHLTHDEHKALTELKAFFEESINHIDGIINGKEVEMNLDMLLRDHNIDPVHRNEEIKFHLRKLKTLASKIYEENQKGGN